MNAAFEKTLKDLRQQEAKLQAKKDSCRRDAIEEINKLLELFDIKAFELTFKSSVNSEDAAAGKKTRRSPGEAKPKYRAPDGTTWSGRGRTKKAIQKALDSGITLEQMLIKD